MMKFGQVVDSYQYDEHLDVEKYKIPIGGELIASIVRSPYSQGGDRGLWEVALLHNGNFVYPVAFADIFNFDKRGFWTEKGVTGLLIELKTRIGNGIGAYGNEK